MTARPELRQFRIEMTDDGILHLVFDMPDRTMNVFSNAAIHEIERFADWLPGSDVRGVVVRSGKPTAFCAGADLGELGLAYDMIMTTPRSSRFQVARDHFAPIGRAFRKLETAGKPVAAAIHGLALGGGCELALACHYRVMSDAPQTALGLPESLVGLFPGAGGTQRMPRLVGLDAAFPILLEGARLNPRDALAASAAHEIVEPGLEVAAAERWIRSNPAPTQPWDRPDWRNGSTNDIDSAVAARRTAVMTETGGHYPALLAILDCLERGLPVPMAAAVAIEIDIFAELIQRPEPRNMIQTLFQGKQDHDRARKAGTLPPEIAALTHAVAAALRAEAAHAPDDQVNVALRHAGFTKALPAANSGSAGSHAPKLSEAGPGSESANLWFEAPQSDTERLASRLLAAAALSVSGDLARLGEADQRIADYAVVRELGFPAYLGGPFALLRYLGADRVEMLTK